METDKTESDLNPEFSKKNGFEENVGAPYDPDKVAAQAKKLEELEKNQDGWNDIEETKWKKMIGTDDIGEIDETGETEETGETGENSEYLETDELGESGISNENFDPKNNLPEKDYLDYIKKEIDKLYPDTEGETPLGEKEKKMRDILNGMTSTFDSLQRQLKEQEATIKTLEENEGGFMDMMRQTFNDGVLKTQKFIDNLSFKGSSNGEKITNIEEKAQFLADQEGVDIEEILMLYIPQEIDDMYSKENPHLNNGEYHEIEESMETNETGESMETLETGETYKKNPGLGDYFGDEVDI